MQQSSILSNESQKIAARLMRSLPAATFEMDTFLRLAGIVATRKIPTAAMECVHRPRLLINPDFVAKHCNRDEHLFLLVMHELWHVLLAHTSLYPRMTEAHNIAFDAIINAGLMRQFSGPDYWGFFDKLNPADKFPHLLLRPPEGWPDNPKYPDDVPIGTKRIMMQLYPPKDRHPTPMPFYSEILNLILKDKLDKGEIQMVKPILLGDHSDETLDVMADTFFQEVMGQVTDKWPSMPPGLKGRGAGRNPGIWKIDLGISSEAAQRVFSRILIKCLGRRPGMQRRRSKMPVPSTMGSGVLPNPRDRLATARRKLGLSDVLWAQQGEIQAKLPENPSKAHIYLDVSGSMSEVIPHVLRLILPYVAAGKADIFQFSTVVEPLTFKNLRNGEMLSTGGTNIDCVMKHLIEKGDSIKRVLILTDGYTGLPEVEDEQILCERKTRVHVVLPNKSPYRDDLERIATSITILPPLSRE